MADNLLGWERPMDNATVNAYHRGAEAFADEWENAQLDSTASASTISSGSASFGPIQGRRTLRLPTITHEGRII
jgi:hypothetical protein